MKTTQKNNNYIYADNAATTMLRDEALDAMMPYLKEKYGNPSSIYSFAQEAKNALEDARGKIASALNAEPGEIIFTGSGTEADNHAIRGAAHANAKKGNHLITTEIEHHAVLNTFGQLEKEGFEVTYVGADEYATVNPEDIAKAIRPDTTLISVMAANNEVGTVQPIAEIGRLARGAGALFHTDAVQAAGHIPIDVREMNIDLLSLSGHKFNGPRGTGALYIRKGIRIPPLILGGGQEDNRRSGTENVAGAVGMAYALELAVSEMESEDKRLRALAARLDEGVLNIPHTKKTGHPDKRLPGISSYTIEFIEGESLVLRLDFAGIAASTGSACSTGSLDPSHVLMAMGMKHEVAHGSLRLSLGRFSTGADVDAIVDRLPGVVETLRAMSPVWKV